MNPTSRTPPSWQQEPCPPWCVTTHQEDDLPGDRFHDGTPEFVSVLVPDPDADDDATSSEMLIARSRRVGTHRDWVFIGPLENASRGFTISPESTIGIADALNHLLHQPEPPAQGANDFPGETYKSVD